jgi:hypothetical protein
MLLNAELRDRPAEHVGLEIRDTGGSDRRVAAQICCLTETSRLAREASR